MFPTVLGAVGGCSTRATRSRLRLTDSRTSGGGVTMLTNDAAGRRAFGSVLDPALPASALPHRACRPEPGPLTYIRVTIGDRAVSRV
jgi:hypothetical protein